jgi:hypothetical protein
MAWAEGRKWGQRNKDKMADSSLAYYYRMSNTQISRVRLRSRARKARARMEQREAERDNEKSDARELYRVELTKRAQELWKEKAYGKV